MALLGKVASEQQKERYLPPVAAGELRCSFALTEPPPGAGSDPSMLRTSAERIGGGWRIDGDKRFVRGADGAFTICMAKTGDGATRLLVDAANPVRAVSGASGGYLVSYPFASALTGFSLSGSGTLVPPRRSARY
jgi:acyl-CoA dehydrogenase